MHATATAITERKKKRDIHVALQQNKELGGQTVVIVISAFIVSERTAALVWHSEI